MASINVYMRHENGWLRALEIPREDIKKFCHRPLKWLRFVCFAALGSKGDLVGGGNFNIINYDIDSVTDLAEDYYFLPDGDYHLIDDKGLSGHLTAGAKTPHRSNFRKEVARRDGGRCVVTLYESGGCDAVHIIPHSKGNQYIRFVISERGSLYGFGSGIDINIDATENGMFLRKDLHYQQHQGRCAFLQTPNFALGPTDIPRVESGEIPVSRTTLQHIRPSPEDRAPIPQCDVQADWFVQDAPLSIFLDFTYGIAAIKRWATEDIQGLCLRRRDAYATVLSNTSSSHPENDADASTDPAPPDDESEYLPLESESESDPEMSEAIDTAMAFSLFFKGYPPGTTVDTLCQKREEEAEMRSRQVARDKVQGWLSKSLPQS